MRRMVLLYAVVIFIAGLAFAEEDIKNLSTKALEGRLDEVSQEINEIETKVEYLRTEEPQDFEYSPANVERTGVAASDIPRSKLLNPAASVNVEKRLKELKILKETIEKELNSRYIQK